MNIKKLYRKFSGTNSHGIVSSQFLAALNIFFNGGGEELSQRFIEEFYQNMTVSTLSMNNSFKFDAFTELLTSLSVFFRGLGNTQIQRIRSEDDATALQLKRKFEFDDPPPPPPYPVDTIADNLNIEPEETSEKIKHDDGDNVEPTLETATKIENINTQRKFDKVWLDNFLNRVKTTKQVLQELNDQAIADLLYEELNAPTTNTQIDPIFIDDNDVFSKDDLTDENKELIKT